TTKPEVTPEIEAKKGSITEKTSEINGLIEAMAANRTASPVVDVSADEMKANQVENQVFSTLKSIISNPKSGTTEMQLTLTPDDLGRINIKLVNAGGNISVEIAAQSETTQKLLESKLPSLIAGLQGTNSNVESVKVVEPNQNAQNGSLNLNNFTANGQNSSNQNNRNRTHQTKQQDTFYAREILKPASTQEFKGGNKLWQTV
ncbi:MAG: flagellar hook-length control protein FliK, partial [Oscillospiraceae bacterium]